MSGLQKHDVGTTACNRWGPKQLTPKQARWQEFLAEFYFEWIHKPGRDNCVADALSRKTVGEYVAALTSVMTDFMDRVREQAPKDPVYRNWPNK